MYGWGMVCLFWGEGVDEEREKRKREKERDKREVFVCWVVGSL